ncbi:MAG: RNA polymerase-binding protein DksA [Gammaproteobacteria bacterium WSBS_2016_MAG_OTU1]
MHNQPVETVTMAADENKKRVRRKYLPNSKEKYMSARQEKYFIEVLRQMLTQISITTEKTIDALRVGDAALPDENDRASKEADFVLELRERERESHLVQKIRHALQRLDTKEFGYCEECGDKIGLQRLLARPVATLCFDCKNLQEYKEKIHS